MRNVTRFQKLLTLAALALSATVAFADNGGKDGSNAGEVRLRAKLAGPAIQGAPAIQNRTPEGSADFRIDHNGQRTRLNVEVEDVNLPGGTVLMVAIVHGGVSTAAGTITLSNNGFGELELESQNGAMVPAAQSGDMVTVSNGTITIVAGVLGSM
jgi:hypothetical protein